MPTPQQPTPPTPPGREIYVSVILCEKAVRRKDGYYDLIGVGPPVVSVNPGATKVDIKREAFGAIYIPKTMAGGHSIAVTIRDVTGAVLARDHQEPMDIGREGQLGAFHKVINAVVAADPVLFFSVDIDGLSRAIVPILVRTITPPG
jgi:hypothetical protein